MAINTLGLDFALPENRYIGPAAPVATPEDGGSPFFNLPDPKDDLAYVEGLTDQYFDTRGKIERYATDMQKRYGVNVTQPDYSQPGGGQPFKGYQQLATKLLVIANDLKTSQKRQEKLDPYYATGQIRQLQDFDPTAQPINKLNPNEMFHSTKLLPEIEQANEILKTSVYTEADQKRFKEQVTDPLIARLTKAMNREGISAGEKAYLQYNIDALVQQPRSTPYAVFQNTGRNKSTVEIDLLKKVTNLSQAKWAPGSYTPDTDENGNPVFVNKSLDGIQAGEHTYDVKGTQRKIARVIDGLVKKADGVYFTFKQQDDVEIPPVKVSSKSGDEVTTSIIESNPKFGSVHKMYEAMREMGFADESGSLINEKLLAGEEFDTPDPTTLAGPIQAEKDRIKAELEKKRKSPGIVDRESAVFTLPDGSVITFYPNRIGGGWYSDDVDGENMKTDDVIKFLAEEKYFNKFLPSENQTTPTTPEGLITTPELAPLPGETQAQYDLRRIKARKQK